MDIADVVEKNRDLYVGWLREACSIPSLEENPEELAAMAEWIEARLGELGATVERLTYEDAPDVLLATAGTGDRTLLFYDHYDVQPVDPIELWESKPFDPEIRDGVFFARGAADNKGDLVARLAGLHAYLQTHESLPCAIKFLIEGQEESGSASFEAIVDRYAARLEADGCIWEGHGVDHTGRPEFVFGAKGLAYIELTHRGLKEDQHSSLAVVVPSPVWHMIEALATLRAPDGKVTIDGFYENVVPPTQDDIDMLKRFPSEEDAERERVGVDSFVGGVTGLDYLVRNFFEPTCNIAGIHTGYIVPGRSKTVLPREILVKIDLRLVPNQDPDEIVNKLRSHLDSRGFGDINVNLIDASPPARSPADSLVARATLQAAEEVFDREPAVAPMMIGTGPMHTIATKLGIPTVSPAGVHHPGSNIHAPNENCRVEDFLTIARYTAAYLDAFATGDLPDQAPRRSRLGQTLGRA